ncbi:hypothetical protein [Streptomyces inhibens]|nr:hypothetical protein [Streptomyces inhibens]UKY55618.1 hypothetical protein KI385_42425 [Streptomyces inhibens]
MLEVHFTARSDHFATDDDRWLRQVRSLREALGEEAALGEHPTKEDE